MSDSTPKPRCWLRRGLLLLLVFVLAPFAFYGYLAWQGQRELQAVLDDLDANEAPWRSADLEAARKPTPAEQDVRGLIRSVHRQVPGSFSMKIYKTGERVHPYVLLSSDDFDVYREELAPLEGVVAEACRLADMPNGRLHLPYPKNFVTWDTEDIQRTRVIANLLQTSAQRHAHAGNLDAAMEDCLAIAHAAPALQDEPTLIPQLVRMAIQAIALWNLEVTLGHGQPATAKLVRLQKAWEDFDSHAALKNGYLGERAGYHLLFEDLAAGRLAISDLSGRGKGAEPPLMERIQQMLMRAHLRQAHAWCLRHMTEMIHSLDLPEGERSVRWDQLNEQILKAPRLVRMLWPAMDKTASAHRRVESRTRCAIAALAAERFRHDHQRWPKGLEELSPKYLSKPLTDPYTAGSLGWRATGDGIVVYSVGPDGKGRGTYQEEVAKGIGGVISYEFRLWDVPHRRQANAREP